MTFRTLQFTWLYAVIFMSCAWKFDRFQFKCVCCFYCFNADVTIYDFCNTKRRITVTQEGTRAVKHSGRIYIQGTPTFQSHRRTTIRAIGWEVQFGQHFRRYREFMSLNFCILLLRYRCVIVYAYYTQIMLLQISLQLSCVTLILCFYIYFMLWCCYGSHYILCLYEETL